MEEREGRLPDERVNYTEKLYKEQDYEVFLKSDFCYLEELAEQIIMEYDPEVFSQPHEIDIDRLVEFYYGVDINFIDLKKEGNIVGMVVLKDTMLQNGILIKPDSIVIDKRYDRERDKRLTSFIIAFHLSHYILHKDKSLNNGEEVIICHRKIRLSDKTDMSCERLEALTMALAMLIPGKAAENMLDSMKFSTIPPPGLNEAAVLGCLFNVSMQMTLLRLAILKKLSVQHEFFSEIPISLVKPD